MFAVVLILQDDLQVGEATSKSFWLRVTNTLSGVGVAAPVEIGPSQVISGFPILGFDQPQNWETTDDLARAYLNWSSYAYTAQGVGYSEPEAFARRLTNLQVVLQNQDNREHDLLDSDDYYQ